MTNVLIKIEKVYNKLTKSEKKIADYVLNRPHYLVKMSVQQFASEIGTSTASIVRFSKKVAEGGFQDLKLSISRFLPDDTKKNNLLELVDNESIASISNKLLTRAKETLNDVSIHLNERDIGAICDQFKRARTVFLFGYGASYVIATDLFQKFSRIGLNVRFITETHQLTSTLATHDYRDCVVFITNHGSHSELQAMAKVAADHHVSIITISSTKDNPVAQISDHTLTYGQTDENELRMAATTSLFAQLFTVDVLYYRYIALNYQNSLDSITQSKMALDNYRKHISNIHFKH
ncbi:MurR/RpiR family transcriptional regulator [Staphylococcus sp. SQ8-PEA]|uniref:MurR/RpiR family transcriptional regulator n=1 Tax=Staphylococcus marylandisciuri TaxID=2981529 RepID=A0ABT2QMM1_9STAP|nr:MurR/RpiR family transcriptional regulator [Staphylococcus marylandisciuri]MCU5745221.1 MurR/RpiR family transcriptional regulator [Staphylococcus marylandisciuri]